MLLFLNIGHIDLIFDMIQYDIQINIFAKYDFSMLSQMAKKTADTRQ